MQYSSLSTFLSQGKQTLAKGPVALIFIEDEVEIDSTLRHHLDLGFQQVVALMPGTFSIWPGCGRRGDPRGL